MSAEPLLLLPGFMADGRMFAPQIEEFSGERPIHIAALGGAETVEEMAREVLAYAPPAFALAGHWLGGLVAMEILRRAPERVTRIALMDVLTLAETPKAAAERDPRIALARSGRLADAMDREIPAAALAPGGGRAAVTALIHKMAEAQGTEAFARQSRALMRRPDQQRTLRTALVRALILCGEYDTICPPRRHEFLAELMPKAELRVIPDAGHLPSLEQPRRVNAALRDWLGTPYLLGKPVRPRAVSG